MLVLALALGRKGHCRAVYHAVIHRLRQLGLVNIPVSLWLIDLAGNRQIHFGGHRPIILPYLQLDACKRGAAFKINSVVGRHVPSQIGPVCSGSA